MTSEVGPDSERNNEWILLKQLAIPVLLVIALFVVFVTQVGSEGSVATSADTTTTTIAGSLGAISVDGAPENQAFAEDGDEDDDSAEPMPIFEDLLPTTVAPAPTTTTTTTAAPATTTTTTTAAPAASGGSNAASTDDASTDAGGSAGGTAAAAPDEAAAEAPAVVGSDPAPAPAVSGAAPLRITAPTCGTLEGASTRTAPFTGLSASIPANLPAVVVKVSNNSSSSRATLIGLDQADIVFEQRIEDRATRFFSIFHSSLPSNVGPVRSGRIMDGELVGNLSVPVYAYSGANAPTDQFLARNEANGNLVVFRNNDATPFARDSRWSAPDNLFVSPAGLGACSSGNPTPIFSYGAANSGTAQPASRVSLDARSPFQFDWNGSTWTRSQSGTQHVTREGAALAPENVVIMFVDYEGSSIDALSVEASTIGSGPAWMLRDGTVTVGNWSRSGHFGDYKLTDGNGSQINLAPGQTWVVLAPEGTASVG